MLVEGSELPLYYELLSNNRASSETLTLSRIRIYWQKITTVGQMQLKKRCSGTILTAISKDEFKKVILSVLSSAAQEAIKQRIMAMYKLKEDSKSLLDIAKRGVEIAIETDEKTAAEWINQELDKYSIVL